MPFLVNAVFIVNGAQHMPRLMQPAVFHPRLQFRYSIFSSRLPGAAIYARSAEQPSFDNNPVTIDYMSTYFKMKGKTKWNDIKLSCYSFEGITETDLFRYFNKNHLNVREGIEYFADDYKHDMTIVMLAPWDTPTASWQLVGAFIADASWGTMDYAVDDVIECEITIVYDYAILN